MVPVAVITVALTLTPAGDALQVLLDDDGRLPAVPVNGDETDLDQVAANAMRTAGGPAPARFTQLGATAPADGVLTITYLALAPAAGHGRWSTAPDLPAAEHQVLDTARARLTELLEHTTLATALLPAQFTIAQLRTVYDLAWTTALDPRNFHRNATAARRFIEPTGQHSRSGGRPAELYRPGPAQHLHPALHRPST